MPILLGLSRFGADILSLPGCKVRSLVAWSIIVQYSPAKRTRGADFLGVEVGVLMVDTWFAMRPYPWRQHAHVLYLCTCGTLGVSVPSGCAAGVIGSVS